MNCLRDTCPGFIDRGTCDQCGAWYGRALPVAEAVGVPAIVRRIHHTRDGGAEVDARVARFAIREGGR